MTERNIPQSLTPVFKLWINLGLKLDKIRGLSDRLPALSQQRTPYDKLQNFQEPIACMQPIHRGWQLGGWGKKVELETQGAHQRGQAIGVNQGDDQ